MSVQRLREQNIFGGFGGFGPPEQSPTNVYPSVVEGGDMGGYGADDDPYRGEEITRNPYPTSPVGSTFGTNLASEGAMGPSDIPYTALPKTQVPGQTAGGYARLEDMMDAINRVYTPDNTSRDRFNALLDTYPKFEQPSGARRWAAGLQAIGAYGKGGDTSKILDNVLLANNMRDVEEWKNRADAFGKAYQFENSANNIERQVAANAVTGWSAAERARIQEENYRQRNEIALLSAKAREAKMMGGEVKIEDGIMIIHYPGKPPEVVGRIPGTISEAELAHIKGSYQVQTARERTATTAAQGGVVYVDPATGQAVVINPRIPGSPAVPVPGAPSGAIRPGTDRPRPENAKEDAAAHQKTMETLYATTPAGRKWIKRSPDGTYRLDPDGPPRTTERGYFGTPFGATTANPDEVNAYEDLKAKLYPGYVPNYIKPTTPPPNSSKIGPQGSPLNPKPTSTATTTAQPPPGIPRGARIQHKGNQWRYSTDGGKTWKIVSY